MQFPIIVEKDNNGYYATCPSLEGCSTSGNTYDEVLSNIKDAIMLYVKDCVEDGEIIMTNELVSLSVVDLPLK